MKTLVVRKGLRVVRVIMLIQWLKRKDIKRFCLYNYHYHESKGNIVPPHGEHRDLVIHAQHGADFFTAKTKETWTSVVCKTPYGPADI